MPYIPERDAPVTTPGQLPETIEPPDDDNGGPPPAPPIIVTKPPIDEDRDRDREPYVPPAEILAAKEAAKKDIGPPTPLLEVSKLPAGERSITEPGMIGVTHPKGGMTFWRETDTGYIQLGGPTYETRWQPFIPTTPSKELREALDEYSRLEGKEQFEQGVRIGLFPTGSEYVEVEDGWGYLTPEQVETRRRYEAQLERYEEAIKESGLTPEQIAEIQSGKYQVYDYETDKFVPVTKAMYELREEFYETLPLPARGKVAPPGAPRAVVGIPGYAAMVEQIREFVIPNPDPEGPEEIVDLVSAVKSKVPISTLLMFFPSEAVEWAKEVVRVEEQTASVQEAELYYRDRWWYYDPEAGPRIISGTERERLLGEDPNAPVVKAQPALVLPADPHWAELKDLPKDDPRRQAYQKLWGEKVIDTAAFATMVVAPWISPAIGTGAAGITTLMLRPLPLIARGLPLVPKVIGFIPRIASGLAQLAVVTGPPTHLAVRAVDEQKLLYYDKEWEEFSKLSAAEKERLAVLAGYRQGYEKLSDAEKANVLVHHSPPPELTSAKGLEFIMERNEWMQEQAAKGSSWIIERAPGPGHLLSIGGGLAVGVVEGVGYAAALPLALSYLSSSVPSGTGKETAAMIAMGMAAFFTTTLPQALKANPALASGRITGLFILSPLTLAKLAKGFGYSLPRATWAEMGNAVAISFTTLRIPKTGILKTFTSKQMMQLGESIVEQLITKGVTKAKVKFGDWTVSVRNIAHQQIMGDAMFTFSDARFYPEGQPIAVGVKGTGLKEIPYHYMSPASAPRFGILSAKGERIANPALIVTHLHPDYKVEIGKTLRAGVELESTMGIARGIRRPGILDPILKPDGTPLTGRGWHPDVGDYTILHYMIRGQEPAWKVLTKAQQGQISNLAAKEALLDFALGWHGRGQALKREFAKNPRVKNLDQAVKEVRLWKEEGKWDNITHNDMIVSQRRAVSHPEKGDMKTRYKILTVTKDGGVYLVMDKSAKALDLPGGSVDFANVLTAEGKWRPYKSGELSGSTAALSQLKGESNVWATDVSLLGTYAGKWHSHALAGTRIYEGIMVGTPDRMAAWNLFQRPKYGYPKPELQKDIIWDGKTEIEVYPAVYDAMKVRASKYGWDMSKVKIYKGEPELLVSRDLNFAKRVAERRTLTQLELISFATKAELRALKSWTARVHRIREPSVLDWIFGENDLSTFGALLLGRRKVVNTIKQKGKLSPEDAIRTAREHPEIVSPKIRELLGKEELTPKDLRLIREEVSRFSKKPIETFENYQTAIDRAYEYAYSRGEYPRSYTSTTGKVLTAGFGYVYPGRTPALSKTLGLPYAEPIPEYAYPEDVPITLKELVAPTYPLPLTSPEPEYAPPYEYPVPEYPKPEIVIPEYPKPVYEPPTYEPPIYEPPLYEPPAYEPPLYEPPLYEPPLYEPPIYEPPIYEPPIYEPPIFEPPPRREVVPPPMPEVKEAKRIRVPPGSIAWRQGFVWRYIPPPWNQPKPLTLKAPPIGVTILSRTPRETIQMIGKPKAKVPETVSIDLGIADILITESGEHIEFTGRGLETIVGERIMTPEKGMSIPATGTVEVERPSPLKFGSSFEEALTYVPESEGLKDFIEARIREMISEMSVEDFASRVNALNLSEERVAELLSHMPDRQRAIAERLLTTEKLYRRVGPGYQFAETTLTRPKKLTKKQLKGLEDEEEKELFTPSELREMETESLGRLKKKGNKKGVLPSIISVRGLEDL